MQQPRQLSGPENAEPRDIPVRESPEKKKPPGFHVKQVLLRK
jgi:hypothetical protein